MANTFQPTGFTVTSTFATLASYLGSAGYTNITSSAVTGENGYIRNRDAALNLYVGFGTSAPSSYEIVGPLSSLAFNAGANVNEIWVASASSTVAVGFVEGGGPYTPPQISGLIGVITTDEDIVPVADADGNLINSSISDDGAGNVGIASDVIAVGTFTSADTTTPAFILSAGEANTGYIDVFGKTSGKVRYTTADATAQTVTVTAAAQTVGGTTLTINNQLGVNTSFLFANQLLRAEVTADVPNATATMANLTDLTVTLQAAAVYVGRAVIKCDDSTAAEGISIDFDGGLATMTAFAAGAGVLTGGTTVAVTEVSSTLATDLNWTTITGQTWITIELGFTSNAAGTLIPRFCQGTAHTSGTATVYRGSYLMLTRIG